MERQVSASMCVQYVQNSLWDVDVWTVWGVMLLAECQPTRRLELDAVSSSIKLKGTVYQQREGAHKHLEHHLETILLLMGPQVTIPAMFRQSNISSRQKQIAENLKDPKNTKHTYLHEWGK